MGQVASHSKVLQQAGLTDAFAQHVDQLKQLDLWKEEIDGGASSFADLCSRPRGYNYETADELVKRGIIDKPDGCVYDGIELQCIDEKDIVRLEDRQCYNRNLLKKWAESSLTRPLTNDAMTPKDKALLGIVPPTTAYTVKHLARGAASVSAPWIIGGILK